jgi:hypothetical protein
MRNETAARLVELATISHWNLPPAVSAFMQLLDPLNPY